MKKIDTTEIVGSIKAPFIKATHNHITESIQETTANIIKGLLGSYTTGDVIILHGCVVTANTPGTSSITAGAIYYNGEIYDVDANASIITTGSQTLVWTIVSTPRSGDPIEWSDGVSRNLHMTDKFVLSAGSSLSDIANYNGSTVKNLLYSGDATPTMETGWDNSGVFRYEKIGRVVYLRGGVQRTTGGTNLITTLPVGFKPKENLSFIAYGVTAASANTNFYISIEQDGEVRIKVLSDIANTELIYFDGISFVMA